MKTGDPVPGADGILVGQVGNVQGSCPSLTLTVGTMSVRTTGATSFPGASCGSIKRNDRIGAVGVTQADGSVAATCITGL
jgi:hypothetical protein